MLKFQREMLLLYAVTDRRAGRDLFESVEQALSGGVTIVQLREKNLGEEEFIREAKELRGICHRYGVPLIINDNFGVAQKSGADGIHVGADDLPVREIRARVGREWIVGATAKTVLKAQSAESEGADYLGTGALFPSPTKKDAVRITCRQLREICDSVSIPVVAIGGIDLENISNLLGGGMAGVAVSSAIFGAEDVFFAASEMKRKAKLLIG